jgi:hypothetical protein
MHISFFIYMYSNSLHVWSTPVLIIRRISCINTTSGICHCTQVKCVHFTATYIVHTYQMSYYYN